MSETERRLYDLGVFSRVDMGIQNPDGETDQKYVIYDLEEARRYSVSVGVGAEFARIGGCAYCLDAPAGETGFSPRISLGVTRTDLWGIAHTLSLRTRFSTLEQQAILNYTGPVFAATTSCCSPSPPVTTIRRTSAPSLLSARKPPCS